MASKRDKVKAERPVGWFVRAGRGGIWRQRFREGKIVCIGYGIRSLPPEPTDADMAAELRREDPEGPVRGRLWQIRAFVHEVEVGDLVLSDLGDDHYAYGEIAGSWAVDETQERGRIYRPVHWRGTLAPEQLSADVRGRFAVQGTIKKLYKGDLADATVPEALREIARARLASLATGVPSADDSQELMLSLTSNDGVQSSDWGWEDVLGESYHFPNQYRNMVVPGRAFVYYRGVSAGDGRRRDSPEYFGRGRVGVVTRDDRIPMTEPKAKWAWFATIEDYEPFSAPVPWKDDAGDHFERIPSNLFRNGVRKLRPEAYAAILRQAGITSGKIADVPPGVAIPPVPVIADQQLLPAAKSLFIVRPPEAEKEQDESVAGKLARSRWRQHRRAAEVGRRGEQLVWEELQRLSQANGWLDLRWLASDGICPGWDMQFTAKGRAVAVEVKSTTLASFLDIEITANEWAAARRLGDDYWLVLVTEVERQRPRMQWIRNPWALVERGIMALSPVVLSLIPRQEIEPMDLVFAVF